MTETERQLKKQKFLNYLEEFMEKEENQELINLTEIYNEQGNPPYASPKRILHSSRGKKIIELEIKRNDMKVEKVIRYDNNEVFANFNLAVKYLREIDGSYEYFFIDFIMNAKPDIVEKYLRP